MKKYFLAFMFVALSGIALSACASKKHGCDCAGAKKEACDCSGKKKSKCDCKK
jgi:hypothetical protein